MTIDEFLEKYNRCPFCEYYATQPVRRCGDCCWRSPIDTGKRDWFEPTEAWRNRMAAEGVVRE